MWRKQIASDWEILYGVKVHGFETFIIENEHRKGAMYKADNWEFVGVTQGSTKTHNGISNKHNRVDTDEKLIFCKKIKRTQLSTTYTPTWQSVNRSSQKCSVCQLRDRCNKLNGSNMLLIDKKNKCEMFVKHE